jgi:DNA-directed RNA polymerase specialized sigma24 family protein
MSARMMGRILLDQARRRTAAKRGGQPRALKLDEIPDVSSARAREIIALDDALQALADLHPRKAQVIELRFWLF